MFFLCAVIKSELLHQLEWKVSRIKTGSGKHVNTIALIRKLWGFVCLFCVCLLVEAEKGLPGPQKVSFILEVERQEASIGVLRTRAGLGRRSGNQLGVRPQGASAALPARKCVPTHSLCGETALLDGLDKCCLRV